MQDHHDHGFHGADSFFQEGMDLLEGDHFEEALHAFDHVVRHHPYHVDALFHRGLALINLSRHAEAAATLRHAIGLAPAEALFHSHCGYALMRDGHPDEAIACFDTALALNPGGYQNKVYKACVLAERRRLGEARALLEEVLADHPGDLDVARHHANVLAALGDTDGALAQFARVLAGQPNNLEALGRRATIFHRLGRTDEAVRTLRELTALDPANAQAWVGLLELMRDGGATRAAVAATADMAVEAGVERAEVFLARGRTLVEDRRFDAAAADLRRARALDERDGETHFLLARAHAGRGKLRNAMTSVNRALQLAPGDAAATLLKAGLHRQLGERIHELALLEMLAIGSPDDFRLVRMKAECLEGLDDPAAAAECVSAFAARFPGHRRALALTARLLEAAGDIPRARRAFDALMAPTSTTVAAGQAIDAADYVAHAHFLIRHGTPSATLKVLDRGAAEHPADAATQTLRALVLQALARHDEAATHLAALVERGEGTAEVHWLLGRARYAGARYPEALESFQTARRLGNRAAHAGGPDAAPTFRVLLAEAFTLHHLGRTLDGVRLLERHAGQFGQWQAEFHESMGDLYAALGAHGKAQALFAEGARLEPGSASMRFKLARACATQGKKAQALRHAAAAVELDDTMPDRLLADPAFVRYAFSPAMNRLTGWRLMAPRARTAAAATLWAAAGMTAWLTRGGGLW